MLFTLLVTSVSASWGTIYYVSPSGSDAYPGTMAQPWQTITKAANTLSPGDTVYIRAGIYHERVVPLNSGSAGLQIVYASFPGDQVTVDGSGVLVPEWSGLFEVLNRAYIRVSGLKIINSISNQHNPGILVENSNHIRVEKNYIRNTNDSGIAVWSSSDVIIDGNQIEGACLSGWNENISIGGTNTFEIKNNHVHDSNKEGICAKDGSFNGSISGNHVHHTKAVGIYVDAWDKHTCNMEVYANVVHDTESHGFAVASEQGGLLENVKLYNNVAYHNKWAGLNVSDCCIASHPMSNIWVMNNTIYNNGWDPWGGGILLGNPQAQGLVARNNICSQNLSFQMAANSSISYTADHNLIDGYRGGEDEIYGADHVEGNPRFVNPAGGNFHVRGGSPAIDRGSSINAPARDFDGHVRPHGAGFDIGAFEARTGLPWLPLILLSD